MIDSTGNSGPRATNFIKFINELSGVKESVAGKGRKGKMSWKEVFLRRRILFLCNLRGAIARENALLRLKPLRVTEEITEVARQGTVCQVPQYGIVSEPQSYIS